MTVTNIRKDPKALTLTITVELDATVERAWQLWADPRQLERWWGPPGYPSTFDDYDLASGGTITFFMIGPDGDYTHGWWEVLAVDPPNRVELKDGDVDDSGTPNDGGPTGMVVTLTERDGGGTLMAIESRFPSLEAIEKNVAMGIEEGFTAVMGQIPAILADDVTTS